MSVRVSFIIGAIPESDLESLKDGYTIISKMILVDEDQDLFRYKKGDRIEVETEHGNRVTCEILDLELIKNEDHTLAIFTLVAASPSSR